ncbi:energy-coupling factor transport system ATP-binding protein [Mycoplasma testudineum]|uniref:Energy-coupling factor transport system ATP-binding protein n=1 Tax=Mycoplasma testudineum TaxID=244584 RepID=A0A4R6ID51_9MOLU|nr:ATP-binding cassette domain-containing protein [Mycoplasma testudineum]OYD26622.1 energy-coupling factor transporter ATPase [Mycoplasma testudineum]TDO19458.1 energy-coupling factor transport system ATP-binding protein [Mycoplasma testudineum]
MFNAKINIEKYSQELTSVIEKFNKYLQKINSKHYKIHQKIKKVAQSEHDHHHLDVFQSQMLLNKYKYLKKCEKLISFVERNNILLANNQMMNLNSLWEHESLHLHRINFFYFDEPKKPNHVLKNIETVIKHEKTTVIMGKTGSGKSTLTQIMNGLIKPQTGYLENGNFFLFANKDNYYLSELKSKFGLVFQFPDYQLFSNNIAEEILAGPVNLKLVQKNNYAYALQYLKMVHLPEDLLNRSPFQLSAGQKRRLALASILANQVETLILDEPNVGLDPEGVTWLKQMIEQLKTMEKRRVIIVSHDIDFVLEVADEIKYLDNGRIVYEGNPFDLFNNKELVSKLGIEIPSVIKMQNALAEKGMKLDNLHNRSIKELAMSISRSIGQK